MRRLTFTRGGIVPPDRKHHTRRAPLWNAAIPRTSIVPLLQHSGESAVACVSQTDRVREGMLVGRAASPRSANVHAPIPGVVREIRRIVLPDGISCDAVVIDMDGEFDLLGKRVEVHDWRSFDRKTLSRLIAEHGVVDMDGSKPPMPLSYGLRDHRRCETLILNGSESEPYLSGDHRTMVEHVSSVLTGLEIVSRITRPAKVVIAVESNKPDAASTLRAAVRSCGLGYQVVRLRVRYPQGDERQLVKAVTGREILSGGNAADVGCMTLGVTTAKAIHEAVVLGVPLIERVVTVAGGAVAEESNVKVRIGTPVGDLIEECGGFRSTPMKIVVGGPMTGHTVTDLTTPITKGTRAVLALTAREVRRAPTIPCIQCGRCVTACPMGLNPTRLFKLIEHADLQRADSEGLQDCTECGACGYICPSRIPLVRQLRRAKTRQGGGGAGE